MYGVRTPPLLWYPAVKLSPYASTVAVGEAALVGVVVCINTAETAAVNQHRFMAGELERKDDDRSHVDVPAVVGLRSDLIGGSRAVSRLI